MRALLSAALAIAVLAGSPALGQDDTTWAGSKVDPSGWALAGVGPKTMLLVPQGRQPGADVPTFELRLRSEYREPQSDDHGHMIGSMLETIQVDCHNVRLRLLKQEGHAENNLGGATYAASGLPGDWRPFDPSEALGSYAISACPLGALPPDLIAAFAKQEQALAAQTKK